jgi:hypothetical protein
MKILICACTDRAFAEGLMPMAYLTTSSASAVNDNTAQSKWRIRLHRRHVAYPTRQAAS